MDFINAEELFKQSVKVRNIFIDWWMKNKDQYDLYFVPKTNDKNEIIINELINADYYNVTWDGKICDDAYCADAYPAFTEGQLRKFIEDKTGRKVQTTVRPSNKYFIDLIGKRYYDEDINITTNEKDVLITYCVVACKIAESEAI